MKHWLFAKFRTEVKNAFNISIPDKLSRNDNADYIETLAFFYFFITCKEKSYKTCQVMSAIILQKFSLIDATHYYTIFPPSKSEC